MPRRRGPAPSRRAPPAPTPARSYGTGGTTQQQKAAPPPPAPAPGAAPPQVSSGGGGLLSGLAGTVMQGAALGTGSALAHRAVDSMFSSGDSGSAPQAAPQQAPAAMAGACEYQSKAFTDCMTANNGDMGACQFYFDALQQCKQMGQ